MHFFFNSLEDSLEVLCCSTFWTDKNWNCLIFLLFTFYFYTLYIFCIFVLYCIACTVCDVVRWYCCLCFLFVSVIDIDISDIMTCFISSSWWADIGLMKCKWNVCMYVCMYVTCTLTKDNASCLFPIVFQAKVRYEAGWFHWRHEWLCWCHEAVSLTMMCFQLNVVALIFCILC
jgi:hypothetical protein